MHPAPSVIIFTSLSGLGFGLMFWLGLGLPDVSQGANGIHLSAGPLEGMVEVQRFFTDHEAGRDVALADTVFGRRLAGSGLAEEQVRELAGNPNLTTEGREVSAFDLTEEVDAVEAAGQLAKAISEQNIPS